MKKDIRDLYRTFRYTYLMIKRKRLYIKAYKIVFYAIGVLTIMEMFK
ncbi:hypothetical protein J2X82_005963 [Priestia megaterium]|nr:hypothetical protein [Priestia megaterium]